MLGTSYHNPNFIQNIGYVSATIQGVLIPDIDTTPFQKFLCFIGSYRNSSFVLRKFPLRLGSSVHV